MTSIEQLEIIARQEIDDPQTHWLNEFMGMVSDPSHILEKEEQSDPRIAYLSGYLLGICEARGMDEGIYNWLEYFMIRSIREKTEESKAA